MRKVYLPSVLLLFLLIFSLNAGTGLATGKTGTFIASNSADLEINLINQNPDPARPGETMELTLSVQNTGNENLKNIVVEIVPESAGSSLYPFSEVSGESLSKKIAYLNSRQEEDDSAILKFKLKTDPDAPEGTYRVDIKTTAEYVGSSSTKSCSTTQAIELEVRGMEYAQILTINRANIDLATEETLEFIITNTGNSPLKNLFLSWKDPKGVILPVRSDNTKYVKYLEVGDSVTVDYSVMADVNALPGLYTLKINLSFEDYDSEASSIETTAGLFVGGETDFDVSFSESDAGEISLSVANVGNNEAYSVKVSLPEQSGYRVSGSSSEIVGNLEKGDYTITSFNVMSIAGGGADPEEAGAFGTSRALEGTEDRDVSAAGGSTEEAAAGETVSGSPDPGSRKPLRVRIEYTDARGERISVEKYVSVQLTSPVGTGEITGRPGARNMPGSSSPSYLTYAGVLVLAGAGVLLYRRKKQGKKIPETNKTVVNDEELKKMKLIEVKKILRKMQLSGKNDKKD